jgi:hypothetical protein
MTMSNAISIGERLWFEETPLGGTLHFQSSESAEGLLFQVGLSFQSLMDCAQALNGQFSQWTIRDGSLHVFGDHEELALRFSDPEGHVQGVSHILRGKELRVFRYAVFAIAQRQAVALN